MTMSHGYVESGKVVTPPFLETVGLTSIGRPYRFQGTMDEIKKYMEGSGSTIGLRVTTDGDYETHNWPYLVVDIYDVATSAADAYRKAVVAATPVVNILGAIAAAVKGKKVIVILRYGFTAQPEKTNHIRIHIELPPEGSTLGHLAAALNGDRSVTGLKVANIGVSIAKTVVKILTKGLSMV